MTCTVLPTFYFPKISQYQQIKGAAALLPSFLCTTPNPQGTCYTNVSVQRAFYIYTFLLILLFKKVTYQFIVFRTATILKVKFTLYLHLIFECRNSAQNIQKIISPTTCHWICGELISICNFYIFGTVIIEQ